MEQRSFEGTWEEVARRGPELAGRKVRLTVLDEAGPGPSLEIALASIIESAERLADSLPRLEPSSPTPDWSEVVLEKYRRQGFKP